MLKMFSTQLSGLFKRIQEKEEFAMEDGARLLAQAAVGNGNIYIFGANEMNAVAYEATEGQEPLKNAALWPLDRPLDDLSETDRFLIVTRNSTDDEAVKMGEILVEKQIPFVGISTILEGHGLDDLADVHIDLKLTKGLLPDETGNRFGYPSSMAALFVYYGIKFTLDEILEEYE
ncbi:DUF2529 domain-containing protein [Bacillus sp. DTU_2020_1000418_1_SI_GHA_SEK_038]|uniref:DUF2529 domain-containing protein n=1 Tax=Bacillus sp. DTU_2020_1000418_1_SI_GHA_SEK_038 TaxID=3077585 RepID=UPI0028E30345|nr:DUF2529 domain-containing protein [Bacillus sp. DTU_2020_1000418_1_SI_GHA_SEK_038]WNS77674.1 DUF2529 domain-containing protein [Bacillus sp. DTU_2020_1000418_1_SI_GHA_SEK_038]